MSRANRPASPATPVDPRVTDGRAAEDALRTQAAILAEIRDAIVVTDVDGHITYWNDGATALFGYTAGEMLGRTPEVLYPAGTEPGARIGEEFIGDWRGVRKDGTSVWVRLHARPLLDERQKPIGGIAVATDISARKRDDLERRRLAMAVEQSAESVVITDADARIVYVNPAFERVTGYSREEVMGKNPRILRSGAQSATFYDAMWAAISNGLPWVADMTNRRKDGSMIREEAVFTPITDDDGTVTGYVAVKRDVTRERALEAEGTAALRERVLIADTLQRLPLGGSPEATGQAIALQVVSMTGLAHAHLFLFTDDGYAVPIGLATADGTIAGAQRLPLARSVQLRARASEGPWIEDWNDRPGHPYNAMLRGLRVRAAAYVPIRADGALIGLLVAGSSEANATVVLSGALPGLVDFAEVTGSLLRPTLAASSESTRARQRLSSVIEDGAFHPVFQPIKDLRTGQAVGFEALTRFDDGTPPDARFAEARRLRLDRELELATLRAALIAAEALPDGFLSINVSPALIDGGPGLHELLADRARPIVVEITEHELIADYAALRDALAQLGPDIRLAVDDAGAGVANFDHLVELRPQFIKVDARLVRGVNADPARQALIVALLHFASATACRVVAEGIETEAELSVLRRLGVDLGQGFVLARPAEAAEFGRHAAAAHLRVVRDA